MASRMHSHAHLSRARASRGQERTPAGRLPTRFLSLLTIPRPTSGADRLDQALHSLDQPAYRIRSSYRLILTKHSGTGRYGVGALTPKSRRAPGRRRRRAHILPAPLTRLIGRASELAEIARLMRGTRLLTLTGAGGSGKTRLAQAIGIRSARRSPDGVFWIDLSGISDGTLVPGTVAATLGLREQAHRDTLTVLTDYLATRRLLLILDNCEHLLAAVAPLAEQMLRAAPGLRILTTSREPLGVPGETTWLVPPLSLPEEGSSQDPAAVLTSEAVQLFVARARDADPAFPLTAERAPHVARVCRALDGLPLALELAAAQTRPAEVAPPPPRRPGQSPCCARVGRPFRAAQRVRPDGGSTVAVLERRRILAGGAAEPRTRAHAGRGAAGGVAGPSG